MRIFLICSVRGASPEQLKAQEEYVVHLEKLGHIVHYPPRDTDQNADGIDICFQNTNAIRFSDEVHVFYRPESQGTHFDIGVAFAMDKRIVVAGNVPYGPGKSYARMLTEWEDTCK